jgi:LysM repeat protein
VVLSACNQPYSQLPSVTNTPIAPLFSTTLTPGMDTVGAFGTSTALALSGTPFGDIPTQTPGAPVDATLQSLLVTATSTPIVTNPDVTVTATLAVSGTTVSSGATSGPLPTSAPVGFRPARYELKRGEFPYCIARRFDVDPQELLRLSGLTIGQAYNLSTGTVLVIPQSGSFPGTRALASHPASYTASSGDTIYSVACKFGDVTPDAIAQANSLTVENLTGGQSYSIP